MADLPRDIWAELVDVLHRFLTAVVARGQYPEGHPAIERADETAVAYLAKVFTRMPELVVAVVDGEYVVAERPMPELGARLPGLSDALARHGIECLVFLRGIEKSEMSILAKALAAAGDADNPHVARERIQGELQHVLLRFVALRGGGGGGGGGGARPHEVSTAGTVELEPRVALLLSNVGDRIGALLPIDPDAVREVAAAIVSSVSARLHVVRLRTAQEGALDLAGHSTNVAVMTAAMMLEAHHSEAACVETTAAALLHDVGHLLLPAQLQGVPEPLLDEKAKRYMRHHPFLGARALLESGCPPLWVSTALDHHRGVDARGYPSTSNLPPHDGARVVALANYIERKRVPLNIGDVRPDEAIPGVLALASRYFDPAWIQVFFRAIGAYPPGMMVELTDGQTAIVTRNNPRDPLRPEVRSLSGEDAGKKIDLSRFNVLERRFELSIIRAVPPIKTSPFTTWDADD